MQMWPKPQETWGLVEVLCQTPAYETDKSGAYPKVNSYCAKHSNNKQASTTQPSSSLRFLPGRCLGSFLPGWGSNSSRNSCSACLSPILHQLKIFCTFVQQAPSTQACQGTVSLLHWSVLGKPAICMRLSECLVQARQGREGHIFIWQ